MSPTLPLGKLPVNLLAQLISQAPTQDPQVLLGPGIGLDCAVIDLGSTLLVLKSDPITFASDQIGWYLVQVNANDLATTGATPRWLMVTLLLPEGSTTPSLVEGISLQINDACKQAGITVIGGHTEITHGLDRPIAIGALIGQVDRAALVTPRGDTPGERLLLTKGVPIEATAILGREFSGVLQEHLTPAELETARRFLFEPGISVLRDARIAVQAGKVTAMHDPTEGGLAGALWELADASGRSLSIDLEAIPIPPISARICTLLEINPLEAIASGALLLAVHAPDAANICQALEGEGIRCAEIGHVGEGPPSVWAESASGRSLLNRPDRDAIARLFERGSLK